MTTHTHTTNLLFGLAVSSIVAGAVYQQKEKTYPVTHTESAWVGRINGLSNIRGVIRQSNVPANVAFYCDSVLESQILDINRQVVAAMNADSTKKGGKP